MRAEGTVRRRIIAFVGVALFAACTDGTGPATTELPLGPIVSNQITSGVMSSRAQRSGSLSAAVTTADDSVAYVSLTPGTAPNGDLATVRNVRTSSTIEVAVGAGGFDPVAVPALPGDTIEVVVRDGSGDVVYTVQAVVAARRPPVVVRTNPPPRKRDVPLNAAIVVVFSEPIDSATLTGAAVNVRRGSTAVPGTLAFLDSARVTVLFTPAAPLAPSTVYTLTVTRDIHDLEGEALEGAVMVEFTTAATAPSYEEYFVDSDLPLTADQVGDSVVIDYTVRVLDGAGVGMEGAVIRFRVSTGTVVPETTTSGLGGVTTGRWRFVGIIGVLPAQATAELSACASNSFTRCEQYWPILVIGFNPP